MDITVLQLVETAVEGEADAPKDTIPPWQRAQGTERIEE
jgi:hypothetical protein